MDTTMHASNLSELVLALSGFEKRTDQIYDWYFKALDIYAHENISGELELNELAFNLYAGIMDKARKADRQL